MNDKMEWKKAYRITIYLNVGNLDGYVNTEFMSSWLDYDKGFLYAEVGNRLIIKELRYLVSDGIRTGIKETRVIEYVNASYRIEPDEKWEKSNNVW